MPITWIAFARFEGGKRVFKYNVMKIKDFNNTTLGVKVRCDGKTYTLVDKLRDTHEAILDKSGGSGYKRKIRCSEIELYHGKKK